MIGHNNELWRNANVLAQDMEVATLLVFGSLKNIKTGSILTVDNYLFQTDMSSSGDYDPYSDNVTNGKLMMIDIALEALRNCKVEDRVL